MTTPAVTEMTVSVHVLVVDGTRRMSHKFFEQIPTATLVDDLGVPWKNGDDEDVTTVWGHVPDTEVGGGWIVGVDYVKGLARQRVDWWEANEALLEAVDELPQLYLGG